MGSLQQDTTGCSYPLNAETAEIIQQKSAPAFPEGGMTSIIGGKSQLSGALFRAILTVTHARVVP